MSVLNWSSGMRKKSIVAEIKNENMGLLLHSAHDKERGDFQGLFWVGGVA